MHNPQTDVTASDALQHHKAKYKGRRQQWENCLQPQLISSLTWFQSQPISSALTGSINHRGRLMESACPLRLCVLLQAKWCCTVTGYLFTLMITHSFCLHLSPPLSAASTSHYNHIWLIHSSPQQCAPHLSFCLVVMPSWCFHHHNSLRTDFMCHYYVSIELSLYTSTKASSYKHENLNHTPMFVLL